MTRATSAGAAPLSRRAFLRGTAAAGALAAAPIRAAAAGGRMPFQIMALLDYGCPPGIQPKRIPGTVDYPLGGAYGQPHVMSRAKIEYCVDAQLLYDGDSTPAWDAPDYERVRNRLLVEDTQNIGGDPNWDGVFFMNGEGGHLPNNGDNAWNAVNESGANLETAASICREWVLAVKYTIPNALVAWYDKPSGHFARSLSTMQTLASRGSELMNVLDIVGPEIYFWHEVPRDPNPTARFAVELNKFRDKLAWIRDTYPDKLLCPTVWEEFYLGRSYSERGEDQPCPLPGDRQWFATVATWHGKTGQPWCAQPSMSYEQWLDVLQMVYDVGCDGLFYWASGISWGKYFAGFDTSKGASDSRCGIRGLLDFTASLNGAVPVHNKSVSFHGFDGRGPFRGL